MISQRPKYFHSKRKKRIEDVQIFCQRHFNGDDERQQPLITGSFIHEEAFGRKIGITGQVDAELSQTSIVAGGRHVRCMNFAAVKFLEFFHGFLRSGIVGCANAESDKGFFQVHAHVFGVEDISFERADGLDDIRREQMNFIGNAGQVFDRVENQTRCRVEQV